MTDSDAYPFVEIQYRGDRLSQSVESLRQAAYALFFLEMELMAYAKDNGLTEEEAAGFVERVRKKSDEIKQGDYDD